MTPPTTATAALILDAVEPQSIVSICGAPYRLKRQADLSLAQTFNFKRLMDEAEPLLDAARKGVELTAAQDQQMTALVRKLCALSTDAPSDVLDALREDQRLRLVAVAFFGLPPTPTVPAAPAKRVATKRQK